MELVSLCRVCCLLLLSLLSSLTHAGRIDIMQNQINTLVGKVFSLEVEVNTIKLNGGNAANCSCSQELQENLELLTLELQKEKEKNKQMEDQISYLLQQQALVSQTDDRLDGSDTVLRNGVKEEKRARKLKDGEHDKKLTLMDENILSMNHSIQTEVIRLVGDCSDKISIINNTLYDELFSLNNTVNIVLANVSALQASFGREVEVNTRQTASIERLATANSALVSFLEPQMYTEWSEWGSCHVTNRRQNLGQQTRSKQCLNVTHMSVCSDQSEIRNCSVSINCPTGYEKLARFSICIIFYKDTWVPLSTARANCSNKNGRIVFINSEEKQKSVQDYLDGKYTQFTLDILIDGRKESDGWKNSDGHSMTYFNWRVNQPTSRDGRTYLFMIGSNLEWRTGGSGWSTRILCEVLL